MMYIGVGSFVIHFVLFGDLERIGLAQGLQLTVAQPGVETLQVGIGDPVLLCEV